ncbi:MAG: NAD(P)-binding domain-containing protein, partial [Desulfobacula sp.]|nr:NAD(P)-binding domain-containing protein [Desulfobacula sp.]
MKPETTIVGFIGLGVMGKSMAGHILKAGYELHVYTRTKDTARELIENGAIWEDTVLDLSVKCDVIITIVGFPHDVEEVYFGEKGILNHAPGGTMVIDMTTSSPELAEKIYKQGLKNGIEALDAPVSGGDIG